MQENNDFKATVLKVLNDNADEETLIYLSEEINKESRNPADEIDYDKICNLMYEKIQITNNKD